MFWVVKFHKGRNPPVTIIKKLYNNVEEIMDMEVAENGLKGKV